ncbi:MAG TPA: adenylate kinase [Chthonomonadaceae bacterium]|nr:adenylate kinase [Chthonomonadaceae bacterium]
MGSCVQRIVVLLGPPGAGKGTQAARMALHYGVPPISTGAMFRDMAAQETDLGRALQGYLDRGEYVPDDIVIRAVEARTAEPDCKDGFLLDGFPRTISQAQTLEALLAGRKQQLTGVLVFKAPIEVLVQRFSGRRVCPVDGSTYHIETQPPLRPDVCDLCGTPLVSRPDDAPDVVQHRLEVYIEKTAPLRDYYRARGLLHKINAAPDPDTVFAQVIAVLDGLK